MFEFSQFRDFTKLQWEIPVSMRVGYALGPRTRQKHLRKRPSYAWATNSETKIRIQILDTME